MFFGRWQRGWLITPWFWFATLISWLVATSVWEIDARISGMYAVFGLIGNVAWKLNDMIDGVGISDFFASFLTPSARPLATASLRISLNRVAREYYMAVYGGETLPVALRRLRLSLAFLATALTIFITYSATAHILTPDVDVSWNWSGYDGILLDFSLYTVIILIFMLQWYTATIVSGKRTMRERKIFWATRLLMPLGGPNEFMTEVRAEYHDLPIPSPFVAPFWLINNIRLTMFFIAAIALYGLVHTAYDQTFWKHLGASFSMIILISISILSIFSSILLLLLTVGATPTWRATHLEKQFFPLSVLCADLSLVDTKISPSP
jgi:hypothetical protein